MVGPLASSEFSRVSFGVSPGPVSQAQRAEFSSLCPSGRPLPTDSDPDPLGPSQTKKSDMWNPVEIPPSTPEPLTVEPPNDPVECV